MNSKEILKLAQEYMFKKNIDIVLPGHIGKKEDNLVEVVFLKPIALDPDVIVCPPDNRVWVNTKTKEVTRIYQM